MSKLILTDADEVLLQWIDPFFDWVKNDLGIDHNRNPKIWEFDKALGVDSADEADTIIRQFNETDYFGRLEPYPYAYEIITKLHNEGWKFVAISTCNDSQRTKDLRVKNLYEVFGDVFVEVHCLKHHIGKGPTLSEYEGTWWVEDNTNWAELSLQFGHKPIIITQPYNVDFVHPRIPRVNNWQEIYEMIRYEC